MVRWLVSWPAALRSRRGCAAVLPPSWAVVIWSRKNSEAQYHDGLLCDEWEVVVPELVFEQEA